MIDGGKLDGRLQGIMGIVERQSTLLLGRADLDIKETSCCLLKLARRSCGNEQIGIFWMQRRGPL
jgi:hypothetical protein